MLFFAFYALFGLALMVSADYQDQTYKAHRLPRNVIPTHYHIHFNAERFRKNVVEIHLDVLEPTVFIVLDYAGQDIDNVTLFDSSRAPLNAPSVLRSGPYGMKAVVELISDSIFQNGSYIVRIEYHDQGYHQEILRNYYRDANGKKQFCSTTAFGTANARSAFPCFDEPALKATFTLEVVHHKNQTADSNMPLDGSPRPLMENSDKVVSKFLRTPRISTYSLTWFVCNYVPLDASNHTVKSNVSVQNQTTYSLQIAKQLLSVLDNHTALPYSNYVPKLTQVVVPEPLLWERAQQNWGLVIDIEASLLYNPLSHDAQDQTRTLRSIADNMAHMWFGGLVTHEWWDYFWLTEGLATLYSYYTLHLDRPSERWMEWFNVEAIPKGRVVEQEVMDTITQRCRFVNDIRTVHDQPAKYERAASFLNMFRQIVGDERWQLVVRNYLKRHQLGAVTPNHLYREVAVVVNGTELFPKNQTVYQVMNSWMMKEGLPMLIIERLYDESKIRIRQFKQDSSLDGNGENWTIPYDYAIESSADFENVGPVQWITEPTMIIETIAQANEWIVFNKRQFGPYRINYDRRNWELIAQALRTNISCIYRSNRAQLLSDAFYFYQWGHLDKSVLFQLVTSLEFETESLVWYAAEPIIRFIESITGTKKYQSYFKIFLKQLTERYFDHVSSHPPTSLYDQTVRRMVSTLACRAGNEKCLAATRSAFLEAFRANSIDRIAIDDVELVYCFGLLQKSSDAEFQWVLKQFNESAQDIRQKKRLIKALGCSSRTDRMRVALQTKYADASSNHMANDDWQELLNKLSEGFVVDFGEAQFWRLAELLNDTSRMEGQRSENVRMLASTMDFVALSKTTKDHLERLENVYHDIFELYRPTSYDPEWERPEYFMNKHLEEFVAQRETGGRDLYLS